MCRNFVFIKVNQMTQLTERLLKSVNSISTEKCVRPADWIWNTIQVDKGKKSLQKECGSKESFSIWFHFFTNKIASWKINIRNAMTSSQEGCLFFHESFSFRHESKIFSSSFLEIKSQFRILFNYSKLVFKMVLVKLRLLEWGPDFWW